MHDPADVGRAAADPVELHGQSGIDPGAERRVAGPGTFHHHGDGVVQIKARRARPARFLHPDPDLLRGPVQRLRNVGDRSVVAEQQPGRPQLSEPAHCGQRDLEIEVRRRGRGPKVSGVRDVDPGRVARVQVSGAGVKQADVMLGVTGGVVAVQAPAAAEIDGSGVVQSHDAVGRDGREHAEEVVERVAVDQPRAGHELARVGEMPCSPLMDDDLGFRVHGGDVPGAACVVEVDVRHHHGREIAGADTEPGQGVTDHRRRGRGAGLYQARAVAPDQVARRDPVVPGHAGIDLVHLVPQRSDVRARRSLVHRVIVADGQRRAAKPGPAEASVGRAERAQDQPGARLGAERRGLARYPLAPRGDLDDGLERGRVADDGGRSRASRHAYCVGRVMIYQHVALVVRDAPQSADQQLLHHRRVQAPPRRRGARRHGRRDLHRVRLAEQPEAGRSGQ